METDLSNRDADRAAAARSIGQLPVLPARFIGRKREMADVTRLLTTSRLLTLTGPGGCGKTRLAVAAAQSLSPFEHGAWFVDLGGLDDASLVSQVVATTLGVPEGRGRSLTETLLQLGQLLFAHEDYARAAEFYRRALEKDEVLEEAHRELMRCYARLGERGQALPHYQTFEQLIRDELGSSPAAESAALYQRLKRGEEV